MILITQLRYRKHFVATLGHWYSIIPFRNYGIIIATYTCTCHALGLTTNLAAFKPAFHRHDTERRFNVDFLCSLVSKVQAVPSNKLKTTKNIDDLINDTNCNAKSGNSVEINSLSCDGNVELPFFKVDTEIFYFVKLNHFQ